MTLSAITRKARLNKDVTIKEAAAAIGVAPSHLHAIERGSKPRPKMRVLYAIAEYYMLPIDDLCVAAYRIPTDVFDKVARSKEVMAAVRNLVV